MSVVTQLFDSPPKVDNIVGAISYELIDVLTDAPILEHKTKYMIPVLEELFKGVDWSKSFETPLVIIYDEVLITEILIGIHSWLRTKCADIENITIVTSHHCGVQRWWKQWCDVHQQRSFSIAELSFGYSHHMNKRPDAYNLTPYPLPETRQPDFPLPIMPDLTNIANRKNILYHFNIYGGTYPSSDRMYIILRLLELRDHGVVDYIGTVSDKQTILNYVEEITYFKNQTEINAISNMYDRYIVNNRLIKQELKFDISYMPVKNDPFFSGYQYDVDNHCFASVVRETINFHPYSTVTEKTLKAFLHHLAVIPITYRAVDDLEAQGFWFPHDVIDYSYQSQSDSGRRINMMIDAIKQMIKKFSTDDLNRYYQENLNHFHHNTKLVYDIVQEPLITYRKLNPCDI